MAKKFPKTTSPQQKKRIEAKTRKFLFNMIFDALDALHDRMASAEIERVPNNVLGPFAATLCVLTARIKEIIEECNTEAKPAALKRKKKTPRPKARRKG